MEYTLKLDLVGGPNAETILKTLTGLTSALPTGGILGSTNIPKATEDAARLSRQLEAGKVGAHALGKELKNLNPTGGLKLGALAGLSEELRNRIFKSDPSIKAEWDERQKQMEAGSQAKAELAQQKLAAQQQKAAQREAAAEEAERKKAAKIPGSVGGGIAQVRNRPAALKEFEKQIDDMFRVSPEAKLLAMRKKSEERFALQQQKAAQREAAAEEAERKKAAKELAKSNAAGLWAITKPGKDLETFVKNISLIAGPVMAPGGALTTAFSLRQAFSAFTTNKGKSIMGQFGLSGLGGAAIAAGVVTIAATAIGLALKGLTVVVVETTKSFEQSRLLYAKALVSGLGIQWQSNRTALASIMGVGEQDVFRFGAQMSYLNPKIKTATTILAGNNHALTAVSWNMKALEINLQSLFSTLAEKAAPAINGFVISITKLVSALNIVAVSGWTESIVKMAYLGSGAGFQLLHDFASLFARSGASDISKMPNPISWMKQLPASNWEKMGLVIGPMATNYAKETAVNTRKIVAYLEIAADYWKENPGRRSNGNSWGMTPIGNAP